VRLLLIVLIVIGVVLVVAVRLASARRASGRTPTDQPQVIEPDASPAGADRPASRADGRPLPGSEEDRRRHGQA
jgi:hypothetical protein